MPDNNVSDNQIKFISKLREASPQREEAYQKFLKKSGKPDAKDLSRDEASLLIDDLKNISVENESPDGSSCTAKQRGLLLKIQDTEERKKAAEKFLIDHGKKDIDFLSVKEASELITELMGMKGNSSGEKRGTNATAKQIAFIKNLLANGKNPGTTEKFLKDKKKGMVEELSVTEASELIDLLKRM